LIRSRLRRTFFAAIFLYPHAFVLGSTAPNLAILLKRRLSKEQISPQVEYPVRPIGTPIRRSYPAEFAKVEKGHFAARFACLERLLLVIFDWHSELKSAN
jgi:hypothetical protein